MEYYTTDPVAVQEGTVVRVNNIERQCSSCSHFIAVITSCFPLNNAACQTVKPESVN